MIVQTTISVQYVPDYHLVFTELRARYSSYVEDQSAAPVKPGHQGEG